MGFPHLCLRNHSPLATWIWLWYFLRMICSSWKRAWRGRMPLYVGFNMVNHHGNVWWIWLIYIYIYYLYIIYILYILYIYIYIILNKYIYIYIDMWLIDGWHMVDAWLTHGWHQSYGQYGSIWYYWRNKVEIHGLSMTPYPYWKQHAFSCVVAFKDQVSRSVFKLHSELLASSSWYLAEKWSACGLDEIPWL